MTLNDDTPTLELKDGKPVNVEAYLESRSDTSKTHAEALAEAAAADDTDSEDEATDEATDEQDTDGADDTDSEDGEEGDPEALEEDRRFEVENALRRNGWTPEQIKEHLDDPERQGFALDQADRFIKNQNYIDTLRGGKPDEAGEEDSEDTSESSQADSGTERPAFDMPQELRQTLAAELGPDATEAVSTFVQTAIASAREQDATQNQEALGAVSQMLERFVRRELGESFPELNESQVAWNRVLERAETLRTVNDYADPVESVYAAAEELQHTRQEATKKQARRRKAADAGEVVDSSTPSGSAEPLTANAAWTAYYEATMSGDKQAAARHKRTYDRLENS